MNPFFIVAVIWLLILVQIRLSRGRIKVPYIRLSILWLLGEREEVKRIIAKFRYMQRAQHAEPPPESVTKRDIDEMLEHEVWKLERQNEPPQLFPKENRVRNGKWIGSRPAPSTSRPTVRPAPQHPTLFSKYDIPPVIEFLYMDHERITESNGQTQLELKSQRVNLHRIGLSNEDKEKVALLYTSGQGNELYRFLTAKGVI